MTNLPLADFAQTGRSKLVTFLSSNTPGTSPVHRPDDAGDQAVEQENPALLGPVAKAAPGSFAELITQLSDPRSESQLPNASLGL